MKTRLLATGALLVLAGGMVIAQQPPARSMSPEGSAQVQVLGIWTKPARPAFTLGRETYEGGKWIEIKYGRPLQRGRDLFGSAPNYGKSANDVGAPGFPAPPVWRAGANRAFVDMNSNGGRIALMWGNTMATTPFTAAK